MSDLPLTLAGGPQGPLGMLGALLLGVSMGLTACTVTCLPFMGSWVMGRGGGRRQAARDTAVFLAGRVLAYATLGLLAGALGTTLGRWLTGGVGHVAIGSASCAAGVWLLVAFLRSAGAAPTAAEAVLVAVPRAGATAKRSGASPPAGCGAVRRAGRLPPFLLGVSLALTPCAPLGWLLAVCALSGDAAAGFGRGLAFGVGAAVTPLLVLVPLFGGFGARLLEGRAWLADWLSAGAGFVLVALGVRRLLMA